MSQTYPLATSRQPRGVRRVLLETGYHLSAFPIALVGFVVVVTDLALGVGRSVIIGGVLLLWVGVMVARGFARFERLLMRELLGRCAPTPRYLCGRVGDGFWRRALTPLRDPQSWLDVVWSLVALVTGNFAFSPGVAPGSPQLPHQSHLAAGTRTTRRGPSACPAGFGC